MSIMYKVVLDKNTFPFKIRPSLNYHTQNNSARWALRERPTLSGRLYSRRKGTKDAVTTSRVRHQNGAHRTLQRNRTVGKRIRT